MDYQTYAALYSMRAFALPLFGVKVGHSRNSVKRVGGIMSNMDLQDLFVLRFLSKIESRKIENAVNHKLAKLFTSGGSSEFHVMPIKNFNKVYKLLERELGQTVSYQPDAYAVSNDVLFQDGWPRLRELKKNYVA
tara:strand:- start:973 stop:1377 length:405 start_codon:yes stop_codon:yes gene_type:complete